MSYNIDSVEIIACEGFAIQPEALAKLNKKIEKEAPESWDYDDDLSELAPGAIFPWYGEGSGHGFDTLKKKVLPAFDGSADFVVCFEGGDSYTGLRLRDHKVTEHEVVMTLGDEV